MRPWRHLVQLLRSRTEALHDVVHLPSDEALVTRLAAAEAEIERLQETLNSKSKSNDAEALETARRDMKKSERQAEIFRANADARMKALEMALESMQKSQTSGPLTNLIFGGADKGSDRGFCAKESHTDEGTHLSFSTIVLDPSDTDAER